MADCARCCRPGCRATAARPASLTRGRISMVAGGCEAFGAACNGDPPPDIAGEWCTLEPSGTTHLGRRYSLQKSSGQGAVWTGKAGDVAQPIHGLRPSPKALDALPSCRARCGPPEESFAHASRALVERHRARRRQGVCRAGESRGSSRWTVLVPGVFPIAPQWIPPILTACLAPTECLLTSESAENASVRLLRWNVVSMPGIRWVRWGGRGDELRLRGVVIRSPGTD